MKRRATFTATLEKSTNTLWGCHFVVPAQTARQFSEGQSRRVVCTLNSEFEFPTALLPYAKGKVVVRVNKSAQKKLGLTIGDNVDVSLSEDRSTYGLPMPDEFREMLRQDTAGNRLFQSLTDGRKRTLLYFVGS